MSVRQEKVAAQIRRRVSEVLLREVGDPRIAGLISVTRVEVTPDLKIARVFVSVLGQKTPEKTVISGLKSATRRIQTEVVRGLALRFAPHLEFHLDDGLKKEAQILRVIDEVTKDRENNPVPPLEQDGSEP